MTNTSDLTKTDEGLTDTDILHDLNLGFKASNLFYNLYASEADDERLRRMCMDLAARTREAQRHCWELLKQRGEEYI
ncbi:MAG: spore coat protein [Firmicutes bacterium]|nr:spore coat protein [Bacillota bacterium]